MFWRLFRKRGVIPVLLILAALIYWKLHSRPPQAIEIDYVGDRTVTLWNTLAEVRQPVGDLHYGQRVEVLREVGTAAQLRTASGATGWMLDTHQLMDSALWEASNSLLAKAREMPVQASGTTKTLSNLRVTPGRDGKRIFQLLRGTPVVVLERAVADAPPPSDEISADASAADQKPKQEDWLLVLRAVASSGSDHAGGPVARATGDPVSSGRDAQADTVDAASLPGPVAGWVLARFVEPNLPGPVKDYASSADLHVVAWFVLNHVPDGSGGEAPQYLVAGTRGGEGQPCDFTMLRVYTWGKARQRYETAYIESDLCGRLPIRVSEDKSEPEFQFAEASDNAGERTYVMHQTEVHLLREKSSETHPLQTKSRDQ